MSLYDDASLVLIPSGYKEDKLYSVKPTNGDGDFTFTRASSATRVNSDGLIEDVPVNKILQSNTFSTTWTAQNSSVLGGQSGYDGTSNAWLFSWTTGTSYLYQSKNLNVVSNTASIYAKQGTSSSIRLDLVTGSFGKGASCTFDLSNGTAGSIVHYGPSSGFSATINSVGDGWYRIALTGTTTSETWYHELVLASGNIYIQDAQLNKGATAKTYFPTTDGLNVPRIDYTGGGCGSLLLESQRTNLITYSEDFSNAAWSKQDATITSNAAISPDGTLNADLYTTTSDLYDFVRHSIAYTSGVSYTISVFVKQGTSSEISLSLPSQAFGSNQTAIFDVSDGTYIITSGSPSVTIEDYSNGWYRCSLSATATITITRNTGFSSVASGAVTTLYLYGAQVEASASYPTSYIPSNSGSTTTRIADACYGAGTSATFNDSEGVLYFDAAKLNEADTSAVIWSISDGSNSNAVSMYYYSSGVGVDVFNTLGTKSLTHSMTLTEQANFNKLAIKYKSNDIGLWVNGSEVATNTDAIALSGLNQLMASYGSGSLPFYGNAKQVMTFNTALTDLELETLTSFSSFVEMANALNYTII